MEKTIWFLMTPDNEHWDEEFARGEQLNVMKQPMGSRNNQTGETQDTGFGRGISFILSGEEENILAFEEEGVRRGIILGGRCPLL